MNNQMPYYGPGNMQGGMNPNPRPRPDSNCNCMREIREVNRRIENLERRINRLERRLTSGIIPLRDDEELMNQYPTYSSDNYMI